MNFSIEKKGYSVAQVEAYIKKLTKEYEEQLALQKQRITELKAALSSAETKINTFNEKKSLVTKAIYNAVAKAEEIEKLSQIKYNQEIEQLKAFHDKWISYYNKILEKYPLDDDLIAAGRFNREMKNILSRTDPAPLKSNKNDVRSGLEQNFEKEKKRLSEKRIGYITVKADADSDDDDEILKEILPDGDFSSPILTGDFDPIERINKFLAAEKEKASKEQAAAYDLAYNDRSESGFSLEEALNPKEDLADIMRDLGLLMDE